MSLVYYLSREQYGEAPLVYGPHYMAQVKEDPDNPGRDAFTEGEMRYVKGKNKYVPLESNVPINTRMKTCSYFQEYGIQAMSRVTGSFMRIGSILCKEINRETGWF